MEAKIDAAGTDGEDAKASSDEKQAADWPRVKYSDSEIAEIVENLRGTGFKHNPLRQAYEQAVTGIAQVAEDLLLQGM